MYSAVHVDPKVPIRLCTADKVGKRPEEKAMATGLLLLGRSEYMGHTKTDPFPMWPCLHVTPQREGL